MFIKICHFSFNALLIYFAPKSMCFFFDSKTVDCSIKVTFLALVGCSLSNSTCRVVVVGELCDGCDEVSLECCLADVCLDKTAPVFSCKEYFIKRLSTKLFNTKNVSIRLIILVYLCYKILIKIAVKIFKRNFVLHVLSNMIINKYI